MHAAHYLIRNALQEKEKRQQFKQSIVGRIYEIPQAVYSAAMVSCRLELVMQIKKKMDPCLRELIDKITDKV